MQRQLTAKVFAEPRLGMKVRCDDVCILGDAHQKGNHLEQTPGSRVNRMIPASLYLPPNHPRACSVVQEQRSWYQGGCVRANKKLCWVCTADYSANSRDHTKAGPCYRPFLRDRGSQPCDGSLLAWVISHCRDRLVPQE